MKKIKLGAATFLLLASLVWETHCIPPTCYSRVLQLSKEIMNRAENLQRNNLTKPCMDTLPRMHLDVHNSCVTSKLRDFMILMENTEMCRTRPRLALLRRKIMSLYVIINRVCYRDLLFFSDDCEALETGESVQRYGEDRLQVLQES